MKRQNLCIGLQKA